MKINSHAKSDTILKPVSRLSFIITDTQAFEKSVDFSLAWLTKKAKTPLGEDATERRSFDTGKIASAHPCHAIRLDDTDGTVWAARIDEPGSRPSAGETWSTEIFVERRAHDVVRFGAQLTSRRPRGASPLRPSRPKFVHDLLRDMSAEADEEAITESVTPYDRRSANTLASLIYRTGRRLPVVAVSTAANGESQVKLHDLGVRLSGAAHLASLDPEGSWELSRLIGRRMSTFSGAVRIYMPGIVEDEEDPFQHPLWLTPSVGRNPYLLETLAAQVFPLGFRDRDGDARFWHIAQLRQAASVAVAKQSSGSQIENVTAELTAARDQITSLKETAESAEALMNEEAEKRLALEADLARVKNVLDQLKKENFQLRVMIEKLDILKVEKIGDRRLISYDDLEDWAAETLAPHITIHKKALRDCRENGHQDMLERIERTLLAIRDHWIPFKIRGGLALKQAADTALGALGVEDQPCFKQREKAKYDPQYSVRDGTITRVLYDHFKYGTSRNNSEQYRIYYSWDNENSQLLIGKMPTHLATSIS